MTKEDVSARTSGAVQKEISERGISLDEFAILTQNVRYEWEHNHAHNSDQIQDMAERYKLSVLAIMYMIANG